MEIDHSSAILHIKQSGMQCWVRSSQMAFSWILNKVGFSKSEIEGIFYESMFPDRYFKNTEEKLKKIHLFNQLGLGRKLREKEHLIHSIDPFFVKIYQEFGSSVFSPEIFASVITNYLNLLFAIQNCHPNCQKFDIIFDNDENNEKFGYVSYFRFREFTNDLFSTGCFYGQDKEIWLQLTNEKKIDLILTCLKFSPLLIETPGHALVLSGYSSKKNSFIVNDSLNESSREIKEFELLNKLTTIVMFFNKVN